MKKIEDYMTTIPNYPIEGVMFRDITTVLNDADGFQLAIDEMNKALQGLEYDAIAGLESRGFIFGTALAYLNHKAFVPVRKKGKLPRETVSKEYALEYGTAEIEIHKDCLPAGSKVVLVDDLIATGGTMKAAAELFEEIGCSVEKCIFLIELVDLKGRDVLKGYDIYSVMTYEGE